MTAVAAFTLREILRRRLLAATLLLTAGFLLLYWEAVHAGVRHVSREAPALLPLLATQLLATGLYFGGFLTAFLAAFAAVGSVSGEIESGLILAVAARPLPRASLVAGKYLGYGILVAAYAALLHAALVLVVRREMAADLPLLAGPILLFVLQPLVILAVALLASTILPTLAGGAAVACLFAVALIGGMVEQVGALVGNDTMLRLGTAASLLLPTDALYRAAAAQLLAALPPLPFPVQAALGPLGPVSLPSRWMLVYAVLYLVAAVALAAWRFARRDL